MLSYFDETPQGEPKNTIWTCNFLDNDFWYVQGGG